MCVFICFLGLGLLGWWLSGAGSGKSMASLRSLLAQNDFCIYRDIPYEI